MHFLAILTLIFAFSIEGCFCLFFCLLKNLEFHFPKGDPTQIFFSENWSKSVFWLILIPKPAILEEAPPSHTIFFSGGRRPFHIFYAKVPILLSFLVYLLSLVVHQPNSTSL
jgi:hypothetical protein